MTRKPIPREAGPMPTEPAAVLGLLAAGKLEQTCPDCGRWEAAHRYCSWCYRRMEPADWYRNGAEAERRARRPAAAPANPPTEYRKVARWPAGWGECPFRDPASPNPLDISGADVLEAEKAVVFSIPVRTSPSADGPWEATLGLD